MTVLATPLTVATTVTASATAAAGKHTPADATSGVVTMTLPTPANVGARLRVEKVDASANAVNVTGTIRGSTSTIALVWQYELIEFVAESLTSWRPSGGHKTKASLDTAYGSPAIDLVKTCGAVADGKLVADAAITSGSAVLTSATGLFTAGDVGKPIVVAGAATGGADLRTTIASRQSATQVTLAANAATTVSAFGAMWGTDNGPALQTALDTLATQGGGEITIGPGKFLVFTAASHADYGDHTRPTGRIKGLGVQSRLYIAVGSGQSAITVANLEALTWDAVTFVGCPNANSDAAKTLSVSDVPRVTLRDCQFYGLSVGSLAADSSNVGVIWHSACDVKIERCAFLGCAGAAGKTNSVVYGTSPLGFSASDSRWFDWGYLDGVYFNKAMTGPLTQAWCYFTSFRSGNDANEQSVIRFTNCRMDEYAQFGVQVMGSSGVHAAHLDVDGLQCNVSWAGSAAGIYARYVDYVTVADSRFGYRTATPAASVVDLQNVVKATLSRVVGAVQATQITVDSTVGALELNDCTGVALAGAAGKTEIRTAGGPATPGTRFGYTWVQPFTTTLTANTMYFAGVTVPAACKLTGVVVSTGSGAGNLIVALYDAAGTRVAVSASTAQVNNNAQFVPFTAQVNAPAGIYYVAVVPSTSAQNFNQALPLGGSSSAAQGSFTTSATITPPSVSGVTQMPVMSTY